ncbi:hypothetical protein GCM10011611_19140 [Aliidongia dinghuensis]|uniref:Uncharacterized protein n=1 Tax=Aliidongia dinghuensis TaxID=1867774 RepID=A0A8J2YSE5_9PROT|nr:hypothetical protein [Aliidongia dinghuensis]GGF13585.1 hypothetical protein GCM10011611_19140 [Aliidongia dinghuensis]
MSDPSNTGGGGSDKAAAAMHDLERPLEHISEAKFREIARLLEEVHEQPGVQRILDHVRPRLAKLRPGRKPNLQRLFYQPLEDLLVPDGAPPNNGLLPRHLVALVWRQVVKTGDAETRKRFEDALRRAKADDRATQAAVAKELWPWAAAIIAAVAGNQGAAKAMLGSHAGLLPELIEVATLLELAPAVERLKAELPPRPIHGLADEQMGQIRRIIADSTGGDAQKVYVMVLIAMVRMAKRADFLESIMGMTLGLAATDKSAVYMRLSRLVMTEISDRARQMAETDRANLVGLADSARSLVTGVVAAERALKNDPQARRELSEMRKSAEKTVSQVVDTAKGAVTVAIAEGPGAGLEAQVETENNILALRKCQTFANHIGLDRAVEGALGGIVGEVRQKADGLFTALRAADSEAPPRDTAQQQMYWAVRMTELAGNPDDADKLRRDGLKAIG